MHGLLQLAGAEHARPDTEPVDLAALTGQVCAELAHKPKHRTSRWRPTCGRATDPGTAALLRQLPHNLLANALTHNTRMAGCTPPSAATARP
ncbi:hypothetical protein NKH77_31900 [Streptomyces sp. M19]